MTPTGAAARAGLASLIWLGGGMLAALLCLGGCGGPGGSDTDPPNYTPWPSPTYRPTLTERPSTDPPTATTAPEATTATTPTATATPSSAATATVTATPETASPTPTVDPPTPTLPPTPTPTVGLTPRPPRDVDGDGSYVPDDCDDLDPKVFPGAEERCNAINDDCDQAIDEGVKTTYYKDEDGDDYGQSGLSVKGCLPPAGYSPLAGDCDDANASVNPGAPEVCDLRDNDCDGQTDESLGDTFYQDADHDGFGDPEIVVRGCQGHEGFSSVAGDCDDMDALIGPGQDERCNDEDDDCDDNVDEGLKELRYPDSDGDGFGDGDAGISTCEVLEGYVEGGEDCDDTDAAIFPGQEEPCDGQDNDCDDQTDEEGPFFYADQDGDGYGGPYLASYVCSGPPGFADNDDDCDDANGEVSPGIEEFCGDAVDNDCDGIVDEAPDNDGDGWPGCGVGRVDCDDDEPTTYPDALEIWGDGVDNDCDGWIDADIYVVDRREDRPEDDKPWYSSIQGAINAATPGQLIAVDSRTWYGNMNYLGKAIKIMGMRGAENTIIEGGGAGSVALFVTGETAQSILEDVTLVGGIGSPGSVCGPEAVNQWGGGICIKGASPTIRGCILKDNQAGRGAGLAVISGSPTLESNQFIRNFAEDEGGGVYFHDAAGVMVGNTFDGNTSDLRGGGVFLFESEPQILNNLFISNSTGEWGGAIALQESNPQIRNNTLVANVAQVGAGLHLIEGSAPMVVGNAMAFNQQGLTSNSGANLYVFANRGNTPTIQYNGLFQPNVADGGVFGTTLGPSNVVANPLFVDDPTDFNRLDDDFHLQDGSPFIDAGDPAAAYNDRDGSRADIGVYGGPDAPR